MAPTGQPRPGNCTSKAASPVATVTPADCASASACHREALEAMTLASLVADMLAI